MCGQSYFRDKPSDETIREARDIIAKWSSSDLLDQISTLPQIPALSERYTADAVVPESFRNVDSPKQQPAAIEKPVQIETPVPNENPVHENPVHEKSAHSDSPVHDEKPVQREPTPIAKSDPRPQIEIVADFSSPPREQKPLLPHPETPADRIAVPNPTTPLNKVVETVEQLEPSDPQPRKMLPRKPQPRQQRQRTQPSAATDQGMTPMSRKFRVDSPGGDQPELPAEQPMNVAGGKIQSNSTSGNRRRIDEGEPVADILETGNRRVRTHGPPRKRYIDDAHDAVARGPHFQVTPPRRSNLTSITGQFLAYLGVLGLTIGTAMVIYGHFGGYSQYTPTGWLVTTVAQMMLFLGVINLVSGGMEQNNSDVSQRMEYLGEQLMRIEQVTEEALRGPKISAHRYADPNAAVDEHDHAHAGRMD